MPIPKAVTAQCDFSVGQLDPWAKRAASESPIVKTGARQLVNMRILNSHGVQNRPGRRAIFLEQGRVEEFEIAPGKVYFIAFVPGRLRIYDATGIRVLDAVAAWSVTNLYQAVWVVFRSAIYITFPGSAPQVVVFDGANWAAPVNFAFAVTTGGQVREPFYRLSPLGVVMQPSATTGNITLTFTAPMNLVASMVGTRLRFCGREMVITAVNSPTSANATVIESLPPGQNLTMVADPRSIVNVGDVVIGETSGAKAVVEGTSATTISVQLLSTSTSAVVTATGAASTSSRTGATSTSTVTVSPGFLINEVVSGPSGSMAIGGSGSVVTVTPFGVTVWEDELLNSFRSWPRSVFTDQNRLGFCDIPALPGAILWSAINSPTDFYVDAQPDAAIFEIAPNNSHVQFVIPGPESSEFVFCNNRIYYIPISASNPLKPGSVAFQTISSDGSAPNVQPRAVQEVILYVAAGGKSVMSLVAPGAYYRPYETRNISALHSTLIRQPFAIAVPTATSATFEERYVYVLNGDGTVQIGKYEVERGEIKGQVGWIPWTGIATITYVSAFGADVIFSSAYPGANIVEILDDTMLLDAQVSVNAPPAALAAPPGKGPLWFTPNGTVFVFDGDRPLGTYQIDANGNLIPQRFGGENLASATLIAGQVWSALVEPFVPAVQPGADQGQRMRKRRIARSEIYVAASTGFVFQTLNSDRQGASLPAIGAGVRQRRVSAYNQDDDANQPPPKRERAYTFKPAGRAHDPRNILIKDTPGTLQLLEWSMEVSV